MKKNNKQKKTTKNIFTYLSNFKINKYLYFVGNSDFFNDYYNHFVLFHSYTNSKFSFLNDSKFFAALIMIFINLGGRVVPVTFSKSSEEYIKRLVGQQLMLFGMTWIGTKDVVISLAITIIFTIMSEHLLNESSNYCVVPMKYRNNTNHIKNDDEITDEEYAEALKILEKARKKKQEEKQKQKQNQSS
jgi:hypothetical protein